MLISKRGLAGLALRQVNRQMRSWTVIIVSSQGCRYGFKSRAHTVRKKKIMLYADDNVVKTCVNLLICCVTSRGVLNVSKHK